MALLRLLLPIVLLSFTGPAHADLHSARGEVARDWEEAHRRMKAVVAARGPTEPEHEIRGKVVTGYQGWFGAEGDGSGLGWRHYGGRVPSPETCTFDLWPDLSEMSASEKYPSGFTMPDGSPAHLFSSYNSRTVARHFEWMKQHGIDGAMLQRFVTDLGSPEQFDFLTGVMENLRRGADISERGWAVMYDLSGTKAASVADAVKRDWLLLENQGKVTRDRMYLHHQGKPLVAVWGVGFSDDRDYGVPECEAIVAFLKERGCAVMLGVPWFWRDLERDAGPDPALHALLEKADIVSPWAVGRYRGSDEVRRNLPDRLAGDIAWCGERGRSYLPVIFPGFSWRNLQMRRGEDVPLNQIEREGGQFLWSQAVEAKRAGAEMIYVAMFDEIDEATAILKASNHPPGGNSAFVTYEGLPPDHYLWVTGRIGQMLRDSAKPNDTLPAR